MWENNIDILCLQETHVNTNSKEVIDGYVFVYSSGITDKDREIKEQQQEQRKRQKHRQRQGQT